MKRTVVLLFVIFILILFSACSNTSEPLSEPPQGIKSELPDINLVEDKTASSDTSPAAVEDDDDEVEPDFDDLLIQARSVYQKDVEHMIGKLGEPLEKTIMPSGRGKGKDGIYRYKNIICYTYSEGYELVISVAVVNNAGEEIYYLAEERIK